LLFIAFSSFAFSVKAQVTYQDEVDAYLRIHSIYTMLGWECTSCEEPNFSDPFISCDYGIYYNLPLYAGYSHLNLVTLPYTLALNSAIDQHLYWIMYGGPGNPTAQSRCYDDDNYSLSRYVDDFGVDCLLLPNVYSGNYYSTSPGTNEVQYDYSNTEIFWMQIMTQCERCDLSVGLNTPSLINAGLWWKDTRMVDIYALDRADFLAVLDESCTGAIEFYLSPMSPATCDSEAEYGCASNENQ
jgi:hypothetical protein